MKRILTGLILISTLTSFSQNLEIMGGLNKNNFFDFLGGKGHYRSAYHYDYGYVFKIGIDDIKTDKLQWRFTIGYENYGGELEVTNGGLGGEFTTKAVIDKSVFSMGCFPFNFRIIDRIDLNFGIEYSVLISENFSGTHSGWSMGAPDYSYDLNGKYEDFSAKSHWGLLGRIAYDINLSEKLAISPQYSYYFGLSQEFIEFPEETKSMRHQFSVGFQRKLK